MSTPFTTFDLETMEQWNALLDEGCCCQMPICPTPTRECESIERSRACADSDYDVEYDEWQRRKDGYDAYQAWVASGSVGDGPPEVDDPGPEPEEPEYPESYDNSIRACWAPFQRPSGDADDEIPTLYSVRLYGEDVYAYSGLWEMQTVSRDNDEGDTFLEFVEYYRHEFDHDVDGVAFLGTRSQNFVNGEYVENSCESTTSADTFTSDLWYRAATYHGLPVTSSTGVTITPTFYGSGTTETVDDMGSAITPGYLCEAEPNYNNPPEEGEHYENFTRYYSNIEMRLLEGHTKEERTAQAASDIPSGWDEFDVNGTHCSASAEAVWPKIGDLLDGSGDWPDAIDTGTSASVTARKSRFKWSANSQLVYDAGGTLVDWFRGSTVQLTWDVYFFPQEWDEWKVLWDAYSAAVEAHDEWVSNGSTGAEPDVPTHPGDQPSPPTLVAEDETDTWAAGPVTNAVDAANPTTWEFPGGWHVLDAPTSPGEVRVVNVRCDHIPDSPYGHLPSLTGESYEPFSIA